MKSKNVGMSLIEINHPTNFESRVENQRKYKYAGG